MTNENNFSIDIETEKSSFNDLLSTGSEKTENISLSFEPAKFDRISLGQIQEIEKNPNQVEPMRPMSGVVNAYSYTNKPISMAESSQKELTQLNTNINPLYKEMNKMSEQMMTMQRNINSKQNIQSNSDKVTEERPTNTPKNLMFVDRLNRVSKRPSWA